MDFLKLLTMAFAMLGLKVIQLLIRFLKLGFLWVFAFLAMLRIIFGAVKDQQRDKD